MGCWFGKTGFIELSVPQLIAKVEQYWYRKP